MSVTAPTARDAAPTRAVGALLGLVMAWAAAGTWGGLVLDPGGYLRPALVSGLLVVLTGVALRGLRVHGSMVATAQLLVGGLALHTAFARAVDTSLVPRPASVRGLVEALGQGGFVLGTDIAPVDRSLGAVHLVLLGCALLLVWGVDVLAHTVRRPPLAGLPVLAAASVPVTVLVEPVATRWFVLAAAAYVLLLACDHAQRRSGAIEVAPTGEGATAGVLRRRREQVEAGVGAGQVALVAVLAALVVAPLVPLSDPVGLGGGGDGTGDGGGGVRVATQNPFISLRRDLLEQTDTPLLYARTDAADPSYLRTVILDELTEDSWNASVRDLPSDNAADGVFPAPPGLAAGTGGVESQWRLRLDPVFRTRWLPLPSPLREVDVSGGWRYDSRFLDVALPNGVAEPGLEYGATAFRPAITARALDTAITPPDSVLEPMTELPDDVMPAVIGNTARQVTADAETPYAKAVALQDWFRQDGGFEYSLEAGPGSGLQLLADFVSTDRVGYCEQFAAAMAVMGRTLGIPSRVAVGFLRPDRLPDGSLEYSSDARHAWPEMYFTGLGWVRFEPTPSVRTGASPDYTRQSVDEPEPTEAPTTAAPTPQQQSPDAADRELDETDDGAGARWPWVLVVLALAALAGTAPSVVRRRQRAARLDPARPGGAAEGAWEELRAVAVDAGVPWDDHRSPREQAQSLVRETPGADTDDAEQLDALLREVERARYGRPGGTAGGTALAVREDTHVATVERWAHLLEQRGRSGAGRLARARRRVLPASVVSSRRRPG